MIIKGIFRRYERWNPVHPTFGTFWGMGVGIGCGVGWGPGFGPEVIGYVGAGCGMGFNIGVTLAGIGIGLPVNGVEQIPRNACIISSDTLQLARSNALSMMGTVTACLKHLSPCMSFLMEETFGRLSSIKYNSSLLQPIQLNKLNITILSQVQSTAESFQDFRDQGWPPGQGSGRCGCSAVTMSSPLKSFDLEARVFSRYVFLVFPGRILVGNSFPLNQELDSEFVSFLIQSSVQYELWFRSELSIYIYGWEIPGN